MDCKNSIAPTDEELLRFALDGEALSAEAQDHIEQCETCQQRLAMYQQTNTFLLSHLYRSECPTGQELSMYCAGYDFLPEEKRIAIANHILDCPLCAAEAEETRKFLRVQDIPMPTPVFSPRAVVRRIFAARVPRPQTQFIVRGERTETTWPRQYRAESVDLSLHLSRASSGEFMLLGILTSTDPAENVEALEGITAELYAAPGPVEDSSANGAGSNKAPVSPLLSTQVDDLGNIVFKPVPAGEYVMIVHLPGRELVVDGLTIE
jgi:anti-sigma factor RsiW